MLLLLFCLQRRGGKSRFHLGAGKKVKKDFMGIFDLGLESVGEIGWEGHSRWRQQCPQRPGGVQQLLELGTCKVVYRVFKLLMWASHVYAFSQRSWESKDRQVPLPSVSVELA